jgi:hypothetical protein
MVLETVTRNEQDQYFPPENSNNYLQAQDVIVSRIFEGVAL